MDINIRIDNVKCVTCGHCVAICPVKIFRQENPDAEIIASRVENCIGCGQCLSACGSSAIEHSMFPESSIHRVDSSQLPSAEQLMLLCKYRRSNRAFSDKEIPAEYLEQVVEAAHRAPTATNSQNVSFTVITSPAMLKSITNYTMEEIEKMYRKLKSPIIYLFIKRFRPELVRYRAVFERMLKSHQKGYDPILLGAKVVILVHTPRHSKFGTIDSNLAYQNGSLMAETLKMSHFYTGFLISALQQDRKNRLTKILNIEGKIHAGMALAMPKFRLPNYIDRKPTEVQYL